MRVLQDINSNGKKYYAEIDDTNIFDLIYPIGSIYMSVSSTSPSTLFGGTWVAWGTGKAVVGIDTNDTDFNTVEKTGGSKTNTHNHYTLTSNDGTAIYSTRTDYAPRSRTAVKYRVAFNGTTSSANTREDSTYDETISILQPYITCYMWKRTA